MRNVECGGQETRERPLMKNVLFIEPKNGYYTGFQGLVNMEPLGLELVAGAATPLVENVQLHDDRINPGGWKEKANKFPPDLIGIRCNYTADVPATRQLIKDISHEVGKEVPIVVGGHHISLRPQDLFMPEVSAIAVGPADTGLMQNIIKGYSKDQTFAHVPDVWYKDHDGRFVSNVIDRPTTAKVEYDSREMNDRPFPRRDLVEEYRDKYFFLYYPGQYSVEASRGCRGRCNFCSGWKFNKGRYSVESASRTVQEIESLGEKAKYINIIDDLGFADLDAANKIADGLMGKGKRFWTQVRADVIWPNDKEKRKKSLETFEKLAEAGFDMALVGLESFDPKDLKGTNKGSTVEQNIQAVRFLKSLGVKIWGAQIVFPHWGVEDFNKAIAVNQELEIDCPQFTICTPLPGTDYYEETKKNGNLVSENPAEYDFFHWVVPTKLPKEEIYRQISRLYQETSSFAKQTDSKLPKNIAMAKQQIRSMMDDMKAGRTTKKAIAEFTQRFRDLQDTELHLKHLAQSALAAGGSKETILFQAPKSI